MKNYSFYNQNEENWISGQFFFFATWLFLSAFVITELFIKKEPAYSIDILFGLFLATWGVFFASSYCKVRHAIHFNLRILELVPHIDLPLCLSNIKRIAFIEEMLKANLINIAMIVSMIVSHSLFYSDLHINSFVLLVAVPVQMLCYKRLFALKSQQATLYFPEVKQAHEAALDKRKKRDEAEKHLPWRKRSF